MVRRTETVIQVRLSDIDLAGHAHNAVYLSWFELARIAFLDQFIPSENDWRSQGLILARNEVDHRSPVRLRDHVSVETWCDRLGGSSFDLRYALTAMRNDARVLCAEGRSVMVCFNYEQSASFAIPSTWRNALEQHIAAND